METSKVDGKRIVRSLELKAFRGVVNALRAQGSLSEGKQDVLKRLASTLKIGEERCRCELRRAVNDEFLSSLAQCSNGRNTDDDWRLLSARKIPLTPMIAPQTVFTALADNVADLIALENPRLPQLSTSLQAMAEARKSRADTNASQYNSSKLLGSLLSGKSFQNDRIESYLDEIALREKYARHGWSWPTVSVGEIQTLIEKPTQETSNEYDSKTDKKPAETIIQQLETCVNNEVQSNNTNGSSQIRKKSSSKKELSKIVGGDDILCETNNEQSTRHTPKKKRGRKPKRLDSPKSAQNAISLVDSKRNVRSRSIRDHNKRRALRPDRRRLRRSKNRDHIKAVVEKELISKVEGIGARVTASSVKESAPVIVNSSRRKDKSRQIIDIDFDEIEIKNVKENDKQERCQSKSETIINPDLQSNDESRRLSCNDFKFSVGWSQLIEDETKPHTFNLIPASRRLKLLQKRASSNADNEVPLKRTFLDENSVNSTVLCDLSNGSVEDVSSKDNLRKSQLDYSTSTISRAIDFSGCVSNDYRDVESYSLQSATMKRLSLLGSITFRNLNLAPVRYENSTRDHNSRDHLSYLLSNSEERISAKAVQDEDGRLLGFSQNGRTVNVEEENMVDSSDIEFSEECSSPSASSSSTMSALSPVPSIPEKSTKNHSKPKIALDDNVNILMEERDESNESQQSVIEIENIKTEPQEDDSKGELISKVFYDGIQEITLNIKPEDITSGNEEIIVVNSKDEDVEAVENEELSPPEKKFGGLTKINTSPASVELKTTKRKNTTLTLRCGTDVQVIDPSMIGIVCQPVSSKKGRRIPTELKMSDKTSLDDKKLKKSFSSNDSSCQKNCLSEHSVTQNNNQMDSSAPSTHQLSMTLALNANILDSSVESSKTHSFNILRENITDSLREVDKTEESSFFDCTKNQTKSILVPDEKINMNGDISTLKSIKPAISVMTKSNEDSTNGGLNSRDTENSGSTSDSKTVSNRLSSDKLTISRTVPKKMIELYNAIENTDFLDLLQKRMQL